MKLSRLARQCYSTLRFQLGGGLCHIGGGAGTRTYFHISVQEHVGHPISRCAEARKVGGRDIFYLRYVSLRSTKTPDILSFLVKKTYANSAQSRMASIGSEGAMSGAVQGQSILVWVQTVPAR